MKKYFTDKLVTICIMWIIFSCNTSDDEQNDCVEQLGEMETMINDVTLYQARWTVFEYFDNEALRVTSFVQDQNCLARASISLTTEPILERQNFEANYTSREPTYIRFNQLDEDVALGRWEILEDEPNWVQFEEISETTVKGILQATLVIEDNDNNFNTLPDTLRLNNVNFSAVSGELLNDSN